MKKILMIILFLTLFTACSTQQNTENSVEVEENTMNVNEVNLEEEIKNEDVEVVNEINIDSIEGLKSLISEEYELGNESETYFQMIQAIDGTKVDVNGINIEIYEYSNNEDLETYKDSLSNEENYIFSKNNFLILIHSQDQQFIETFQTYIESQ